MGGSRSEEAGFGPEEEVREMKRTVVLIGLGIVLGAQTPSVQVGFYSSQSFRDATEVEKTAYSSGYLDGVLSSVLLGAPPDRIERVSACLQGMTNGQLSAVIEKYVSSHPERWDYRMTILGELAITEACRARGKEIK